MNLKLGLLSVFLAAACFVSVGFVQTTIDGVVLSVNYPGMKCEGEDSGNTFDCNGDNANWQCELSPGVYRTCKKGGKAELGTCVPKIFRYCEHKGFGFPEGGKVRGCYGKCGAIVCNYAPSAFSCHDDFWWPSL